MLLLAAPARAADVSVADGTLTVTAAPGEANRLTLTLGAGLVTVQDTGAVPAPGTGCTPAGTGRVACAITAPAAATVTLGDGNDTLAVGGALAATWRMWGMDASGDGKADPYNGVDAIYSTARHLRASGAPRHNRKALYAYDHAWWYVNKVLAGAKKFR